MRMSRLLILAVIATLTASPVLARAVNRTSEERATSLRGFARCMLSSQPELVIDYVLNAPVVPEKPEYERLELVECADQADAKFDSFRIESLAFSGAVAEEIVKKADRVPVEAGMSSVPPLARRKAPSADDYKKGQSWSRARFERELPRMQAEWMLEGIAECTVRKSPTGVRVLFDTPPGSTEESKAFAPLLAPLSACIPRPELRINPPMLRGALAATYLRLAVVANPKLTDRQF